MKTRLIIVLVFASLAALGQTQINTNQIKDQAITYAKFQNLTGLSIFGRSANSSGVGASITAGSDGNILYRNGSSLTFGSPPAASVANTGTGNISSTNVQSAINELDGEKVAIINSATAITDASTMDITAKKNTLTTSSATRTFTISYTGDDITVQLTLNTTTCTLTFPGTTLCVSDGIESGDNNMYLSGTSGDKYIIAIKKIGSNYFAVCKNFGQ